MDSAGDRQYRYCGFAFVGGCDWSAAVHFAIHRRSALVQTVLVNWCSSSGSRLAAFMVWDAKPMLASKRLVVLESLLA